MENKSRTKNNILQMRFSFGRAKAGLEFKSLSKFDDYTDGLDGDANLYSQNELPSSPYVRTYGSVKRDANWNKPARITELISTLYKSPECNF